MSLSVLSSDEGSTVPCRVEMTTNPKGVFGGHLQQPQDCLAFVFQLMYQNSLSTD